MREGVSMIFEKEYEIWREREAVESDVYGDALEKDGVKELYIAGCPRVMKVLLNRLRLIARLGL